MAVEPQVSCPSCGEKVPANFAQCWKCGAEMPLLSAVDAAVPARRCPSCQGTDIESGIAVHTERQGVAGLRFSGASFVRDMSGGALEVLRADLCKDCGTVIRLWVAQPDRVWIK